MCVIFHREIKVLNDFARLDRFRGDFWGCFEGLLILRLFPQALCVGEITHENVLTKFDESNYYVMAIQ